MKAQGGASETFNKACAIPTGEPCGSPGTTAHLYGKQIRVCVWESAPWRPQSGYRGEQRDAGITKQLLSLVKKKNT